MKKKKDEFQELLANLATEVHEATLLLTGTVPGTTDLHDLERQIKTREKRGDELIHDLITRLNRAFVTPFDREDLHRLAELLDDVLDFVHSCSNKLYLYKAVDPIPQFAELAHILELQTTRIREAFDHLKDVQLVLLKCREINDLENEGDHIYHHMILTMFETETNPIRLIKNKEIIEQLESATDACEDVADALESIAVKYA